MTWGDICHELRIISFAIPKPVFYNGKFLCTIFLDPADERKIVAKTFSKATTTFNDARRLKFWEKLKLDTYPAIMGEGHTNRYIRICIAEESGYKLWLAIAFKKRKWVRMSFGFSIGDSENMIPSNYFPSIGDVKGDKDAEIVIRWAIEMFKDRLVPDLLLMREHAHQIHQLLENITTENEDLLIGQSFLILGSYQYKSNIIREGVTI